MAPRTSPRTDEFASLTWRIVRTIGLIGALFILCLVGWIVSYLLRSEPEGSIDLGWMYGMRRSQDVGVTRSMEPVNVRVYRAFARDGGGNETTYESLEFRIPQAYTLTGSIAQLPAQGYDGWLDMMIHVHRPTGRPSVLFEDFVEQRLRWVPPSDETERPQPGLHDWPPYPDNHYFLLVGGRQAYTSGFGLNLEQRRHQLGIRTSAEEYQSAQPHGEVCGWQAFDYPYHRETRMQMFPAPVLPAPVGQVRNAYFDSLDPDQWRRTIECGPETFSYCRLSTRYRQFALTIGFSPSNICNWREIEADAVRLLDRYFVTHRPPTRRVSNPERFPSWREWTNQNINNRNIERDARVAP
jgi:hypothetical protein